MILQAKNSMGFFRISSARDVTTGKFLVRPLGWLGRICPPGWNRVKVSESLGATMVALVAPAVTSLLSETCKVKEEHLS